MPEATVPNQTRPQKEARTTHPARGQLPPAWTPSERLICPAEWLLASQVLATLAGEVPDGWRETQESWLMWQLDSHLCCSSQKGQLLDAGALIKHPIWVALNLSEQAPFNSQ